MNIKINSQNTCAVITHYPYESLDVFLNRRKDCKKNLIKLGFIYKVDDRIAEGKYFGSVRMKFNKEKMTIGGKLIKLKTSKSVMEKMIFENIGKKDKIYLNFAFLKEIPFAIPNKTPVYLITTKPQVFIFKTCRGFQCKDLFMAPYVIRCSKIENNLKKVHSKGIKK